MFQEGQNVQNFASILENGQLLFIVMSKRSKMSEIWNCDTEHGWALLWLSHFSHSQFL